MEGPMRYIMHTCRFVCTSAALLLALPATAPAQAQSTDRGASTAPAASVPSADYKLRVGDKLRIEVYKDAQLSQSAQIRPDGKITLPLIGDLTATDRTPSELRDHIEKALKEYVTAPSVTVIVVEATIPTAFVLGEVRAPGAVQLQRDLTVLQALALAGGLTEFAKSGDIRVLRNGAGGVETIAFRYKDALRGSEQAQMMLRPGDTVIVP